MLQALRSHDERLEADINKVDLTGKPPANIEIIGIGDGGNAADNDGSSSNNQIREKPAQYRIDFPYLNEWRDAIFAKIVLKCGDRRYWESWAWDVSRIAERQITRIKALLESADPTHRKAFDDFLAGLRCNLNPSVSESDAIEMLAQHLITQPVFDALFEGHAFTQHNPVSQSMQKMLEVLYEQGLGQEAESLEKFYASVRLRASGIANAESRQKIIVELYDKFFRTAFPRMAERLGIVYTPVEVVDFILKSVDDTLKAEFGESLTSEGVQVLDPFTGTGTFIVRLLQGGFVKPEDLARKYASELHANEIVLLAYYIAAVNIEAAYHGQLQAAGQTTAYQPFEGIVLTDTFQLTEGKGTMEIPETQFPDNNARAVKQKGADIRVIMGNPPYSVGQDSESDNNKNLKYPALDERIRSTYVERSDAGLVRNLYDSYIRAIRWASDRIKDKGIVCFVTNGRFIEAGFGSGIRRSLMDEFSSIHVFNLRGFVKGRLGDDAKREGGNVFGILTGVAITLLVKKAEHSGPCRLRYHDIGDYVSKQEKLEIIRKHGGISPIPWREVIPDEHGDWVNVRDPAFAGFMSLGDKDDDRTLRLFATYSQGVLTARDVWAYNFSRTALAANMGRMIAFYNEQRAEYEKAVKRAKGGDAPAVEDVIDTDARKISWTRNLKGDVRKLKAYEFSDSHLVTGLYRPFAKQRLYFSRRFNEMIYQTHKLFPQPGLKNLVIVTTSVGARREFSAVLTDCVPNYHAQDTGQCFPLYHYEETTGKADLLNTATEPGWVRREAITDAALAAFRRVYAGSASDSGKGAGEIGKEDLFYYVYGILHSPEYKTRFEADLKKQLPRIPYAADFWAFSTAGRELAEWHLNYETVEPYPLHQGGELDLGGGTGNAAHYRVQKMAFAKKGKAVDKTTLIYNSRITLAGIPPETYDYIVNGKPALEWVMERYQMTTDKDSGIKNDPNDWATEHNDPQYILNLVKRIVRVSVETVKIVRGLPALEELQ